VERFSGCAPAIRKRPFGGELLEYFSTVLKGALVGCVATELTKYQIVVVRMDHLIILMIGLVVGFASGTGFAQAFPIIGTPLQSGTGRSSDNAGLRRGNRSVRGAAMSRGATCRFAVCSLCEQLT